MATIRNKGDLAAILLAVVTRLRAQLDTAERPVNESNCYLSLDPSARKKTASDLVFVVGPSSGQFDEAMIEGGGVEQLTADIYIIVTIQSALQLDEAQREESFLTDSAMGVLKSATNVLAALATWDPSTTSGGDTLLQVRDPLMPSGFEFSKEGKSKGSMTLTFKCKFDWNVS